MKLDNVFFDESGFLKKNLHDYDPVNFNKIGDDYIKNIRQFLCQY